MVSTAVKMTHSASGPRPLDLRRDLKQVAALIEEAFGPELDAAGWAALRELRMAARLGPLLGLLTPAGSRPNDMLDGFVWVEDGRVVGNVTTQRIPQFPSRYLIANVAVQQNYRGRGIASELMRIVLEHIVEQGGQWALLQVREDNDIARGMYQRLSFSEVMEEHRLRAETLPAIPDLPLPPGGELRLLSNDDWHAVRYLINRAMPVDARWWHPTRASGFREGSSPRLQRRLSRWLGVGHKIRWGLFFGEELMGVLDVDVLVFNEHRVDILLHPEVRAEWSAPLLVYALRYLQRQPERPISAVLYDYQEPAIAALYEVGFEPFVTLVNMRKRVNR
jgi:ribosomal protein S18 acetylase RimI-like enzyme